MRWLKAEGDTVAKGEPLIEVETDKVTVEIEAPADGTLVAVTRRRGRRRAGRLDGRADPRGGRGGAPAAAAEPRAASRRGLASPKARRMAAELGVDLAGVQGSGPRGARRRRGHRPACATDPGRRARAWRAMAERTTRSWQDVPHFYLAREVDAGAPRAVAARAPGAGPAAST